MFLAKYIDPNSNEYKYRTIVGTDCINEATKKAERFAKSAKITLLSVTKKGLSV